VVDEVVEAAEVSPGHARVVVRIDLQQHDEVLARVALDEVGVSEEAMNRFLSDRVQLRLIGAALLIA
jgi:hypothetical protein